jgi:hypothetical protein
MTYETLIGAATNYLSYALAIVAFPIVQYCRYLFINEANRLSKLREESRPLIAEIDELLWWRSEGRGNSPKMVQQDSIDRIKTLLPRKQLNRLILCWESYKRNFELNRTHDFKSLDCVRQIALQEAKIKSRDKTKNCVTCS